MKCQCSHHSILHVTFVGNGGKLEDQFLPSRCTMPNCDCKGFVESTEEWRKHMLELCLKKGKRKKRE